MFRATQAPALAPGKGGRCVSSPVSGTSGTSLQNHMSRIQAAPEQPVLMIAHDHHNLLRVASIPMRTTHAAGTARPAARTVQPDSGTRSGFPPDCASKEKPKVPAAAAGNGGDIGGLGPPRRLYRGQQHIAQGAPATAVKAGDEGKKPTISKAVPRGRRPAARSGQQPAGRHNSSRNQSRSSGPGLSMTLNGAIARARKFIGALRSGWPA